VVQVQDRPRRRRRRRRRLILNSVAARRGGGAGGAGLVRRVPGVPEFVLVPRAGINGRTSGLGAKSDDR